MPLHSAVRMVLLAAAVQAGSFGAVAAEEGPVAAWDFDQVQGRCLADRSGHGNQLNVMGGSLTKGLSGSGLDASGRHGSVSALSQESLAPRGALSLEVWIQPRQLPTQSDSLATILRKEGCYSLRFAGARLGLVLWFDGAPVTLTGKKSDWQPGQWYHVVATYDGRHSRLYVNGSEDAHAARPAPQPLDAAATNCHVGSAGSQSRFGGVIDELRIYGRALAPDQIAAAYQRGLQTLAAEKDKPVATRQITYEFPVLKKPPRKVEMLQDGFLWIDAEDFADYGQWKLDTQFVQFLGSAYLIAPDLGQPLADAVTEIVVPKAGTYRLWVRAKNWYRPHSPGQFQVLVGEQKSSIFGQAQTEDWVWEQGGDFALSAGPVRLALHDLTGYYARCDALVLTTDLNYQPPNEPEPLRRERNRLAGLSLEPLPAGEFDVIVVGGGAAGSCAAIAAARTGAKTALIQDRPVLGGNASVELGVPINGAGSGHRNARESGIIEEAGRIKACYGYPKMSEPLQILAAQEKNLKVFFNQRVIAAKMIDAQRIGGVLAVDTLTGVVSRYQGQMFLDATGDGWLGFFAGARFRHGREARSEFNESHAPQQADQINMSGCLMGELCLSFRAENVGKPVSYTPPPWAAKLPPPEQFGRKIKGLGGAWWLEREGTIDTLWQAEKSRDELLRISFGYWDYLKNHWPQRQEAANHALTFVPITEGKREGRRLIGDHVLMQNEVLAGTMFPDRISYGGWPLDVHHAKGIYSGPEGPFHSNDRVPIYSVPYRCLYSVNIDNLLFAGRCISVTHIALGTVRVQGTLAAIGQASGTAAALCAQQGLSPRQLGQQRIAELQQRLLKDDQYIPELRNEDPRDLARGARLAASSTARGDEFGRDHVESEAGHELKMSRAVIFARGVTEGLDSIHLRLQSEHKKPVEVTLHLGQSDEPTETGPTASLAQVQVQVPARHNGWVEFPVRVALCKPYVWAWLAKAEGVTWSLMARSPEGAMRAYGGGGKQAWKIAKRECHAFYTQPALVYAADYGVANVINGVTRIIDKTPNMWASDPQESLPQWIELNFPRKTSLSSVLLTFDTDMNAPFHSVPIVPSCVRDYVLSYWDGGQWVEIARETGNFQRRRVHRFPAVSADKLRLTVLATNGSKSARVFEIRAYRD